MRLRKPVPSRAWTMRGIAASKRSARPSVGRRVARTASLGCSKGSGIPAARILIPVNRLRFQPAVLCDPYHLRKRRKGLQNLCIGNNHQIVETGVFVPERRASSAIKPTSADELA